MIDEQEYKKLKRLAEEAQSDKDRATGQLEAAMQRLRDEFECDSLEEAEALQKRLDKEAAKTEKEYDAAREAFKVEWGEKINAK